MRLLLATALALLTLATPAAATPAWLPPSGLGADVADVSSLGAVAVAPDGTAVAAWAQAPTGSGDYVLQFARRPPGGAFGPATTVPGTGGAGEVDVAVDADGDATATWTQSGAVRTVALGRDGSVGTPQTLDTESSDPAIAVGASGRAVVAWIRNAGTVPVVRSGVRTGATGDFTEIKSISQVGDAFGISGVVATVGDAGGAAVAWSRASSGNTLVEVNERGPSGSFSNTGLSLSRLGDVAVHPAVVIAPDGRATALWEDITLGQVRYAERPPNGIWSGDDNASQTGDVAGTPAAGVGPDGRVIAAWFVSTAGTSVLEAAVRPPGGGGFTEHRKLSGPGTNVLAPVVSVGRGGDAMVVWSTSMGEAVYAVHRSRAGAYSAVLPPVTEDNPPPDQELAFFQPDVGVDDQGNAFAVFTRDSFHKMPPLDGKDHYTFEVAGFDFAAPSLTASVPPNGIATLPIGMAATAGDRLSGATIRWSFGDGGIATGGAVQHAFGAPGAFNVTVTATDGVGNATTRVAPVLVAAPPPPPRIDSAVSVKWGRKGRFVYLVAMRVPGPPQGAKVELRCKGKKCPFKKRTFTKRRNGAIRVFKELKPAKVLKKKVRKFRRGQRVQVRIVADGFIGKVVNYKIPKKGTPSGKVRCLPLGATKPRKTC